MTYQKVVSGLILIKLHSKLILLIKPKGKAIQQKLDLNALMRKMHCTVLRHFQQQKAKGYLFPFTMKMFLNLWMHKNLKRLFQEIKSSTQNGD